MRHRLSPLLLILALAACGGASAGGGGDDPPAAAMVDGKPVGLFFMTRFWSYTNSLEKAVWYFAPDGRVYQNLASGFSAEDLAAHKGNQGTYEVADGKLKVTWADSKVTEGSIGADAGGFGWDGGIFTAVKPFEEGKSLAGTYEGGESFSTGGGNSASASNTIELRPDGTFRRVGVASVQSTSSESVVDAGAQGGGDGKWEVAGYSLVLTGADGKVQRGIAFPYDDKETPAYPDRMYFAGTMYKRQ
jgi:hypothetical protein